MGLHGSSTTPLISMSQVPAANVLGEVGKGHKVAFNVLHFGRFKLGAMCAGGAKFAIAQAATYAAGRRQFGQPIASFGAIKHKLGEMVSRTYAIESLVYRTAGMIDQWIERSTSGPHESAVLAALEEFAIEASIAKVGGSEALDYVLDENIQIHGGKVTCATIRPRAVRDSRVNRIFEGRTKSTGCFIPGCWVGAPTGGVPLIAAARQLRTKSSRPRCTRVRQRWLARAWNGAQRLRSRRSHSWSRTAMQSTAKAQINRNCSRAPRPDILIDT